MAEVAPATTQPDEAPTSVPPGLAKSLATSPLKNNTEIRDFEESARPGKRPRLHPPPMSAAAAFAEEQHKARQSSSPSSPRQHLSRETSVNPASAVVNTLMGASQNVTNNAHSTTTTTSSSPNNNNNNNNTLAPNTSRSRHSSPNPATTLSAPMAIVAEALQQPSTGEMSSSGIAATDSPALTSPVSMSSIGTLEGIAGPSGLTTTVGSPLPIEETAPPTSHPADAGSTSPDDASKAFSYPAPLLQAQMNDGARRGMSLPHSGTRPGTRSPSSKKHRCPYCATEFTRHHNLKSHLLTHSQEKPYVCSTCQSRFRRLHDLKRHTKLHTGERPHICPKCGRKFARGDALARHNKGPGGCAGRRASMGSFGGDDDYEGGDDSMEGVVYNEPDTMDDDEEGNDKRPGIRRHAPSGDDTLDDPEHFSRMPSTYPPIQGRPPGGIASGAFPPRSTYRDSGSGSSSAAIPPGTSLPYPPPTGSSSSIRPVGTGSTVFAQNPLTESPKPLSPGQSQSRGVGHAEASQGSHRSPSSTHFPQPHPQQQGSYSRRASGPGASFSLPPTGPQLPPPHGLNPPDPRFTLPSQGGPAHPPTQPSGPPTHMSGSGPLSSHSNSLSSHGHSAHGSGENASMLYAKDDRMWAVIKSLESRVNSMQEEINSLRAQLAVATQPRHQRMA